MRYTVLIEDEDDTFVVEADTPEEAVKDAVGLHLANMGFGIDALECKVITSGKRVADYTVDVDVDVSLSLHRNDDGGAS